MLSHKTVIAVQVVVETLTLAEAIRILSQINPKHLDAIHYVDTREGTEDFRFEELGKDARNSIARLPTFWRTWYLAGPPTRREWIYGSICQFVADAILIEIVQQGEDTVANVVRDVIGAGAP